MSVRLGAHFATPLDDDGGWATQLARFKRGKFTAAKAMAPKGFAWTPLHIEDLIAAGAREIIVRSENDKFTPDDVQRDFIDRGFFALVDKYPNVQWVWELGNEQDLPQHGALDPWQGRFWLIETRKKFAHLTRPNLKWIASMPTDLAQVRDIYLSRNHEGAIVDLYDGIATHVYGDYEVAPNPHYSWDAILAHLLTETTLPIYITEFGINHPPLDKAEKGRRYIAWLQTLDARRIPSAYAFWLGDGERRPQYQITDAMADVLATYNAEQPPVTPEPATPSEMTQREALEYIQKALQKFHPEFQPVAVKEG